MDQGTPEWFAARAGVATASRFSDILARPDTAAYRGYVKQVAAERLTGKPRRSTFTNAAMEHGTATEPLAKAAYEARTGDLVESCGLILHPEYPFAGASPDGLLGADGVIEVKCPESTTHLDYLLERKLPAKYKPQVFGQMWVTGRQWAHFVSYDPEMPTHLQLLIVDVERDDAYIEKLEAAILGFNSEVERIIAELKG